MISFKNWYLHLLMSALIFVTGCMGPNPHENTMASGVSPEPEMYIGKKEEGQFAGCWATVEDYEKATGKKIASYRQSPYLDERELPPVSERLPEEPLVVNPVERVGKFGGTLRLLTNTPNNVDFRVFMSPATILSYDRDYKGVAPGLAKSWEFSEDGKEITLHFRKGLKWSDGVPFTTDDVMFWWEDLILNDEYTPIKPARWRVGDELMKVTKIDGHTLRITFAEPFPVFIYLIAGRDGAQKGFYQCKHYMKQFHPKYTDREEIEERVKEKGFESWVQYFKAIEGTRNLGDPNRVECPRMTPYIPHHMNLQTIVMERNPYFWKVDPEGNQLPYFDRVSAYYVESQEVYKLKIIAGEVDFDLGIYTIGISDIPTLKKNEEKGGYRTLLWKVGWSSAVRFIFNQNCSDPVKKELFNDFRFRKALSYAIDRDALNEVVLFNRGVPCQVTVIPDERFSSYYVEEYAKAYIEYDPDEANRLLDEIGLDKRDKEGYRLMKDGRRFTVILPTHQAKGVRGSIYELVTEYWRDAGVELIVKPVDASVRGRRLVDGNYDLMSWHVDGISDIQFTISPFPFMPITRACAWGPMWARWYDSKGTEGEQPPKEIIDLYECLDIMRTTMDEGERIRAGRKILKSQAENLWNIGTVGYFTTPLIANKHLRNIPEVALWTWDHFYTSPLPPEAFYFDTN